MTEKRESLESIFLAHLVAIERITGFICHRHGLRGADADDFLSTVKLKLIEDDYCILGKFRGESSLPTFLAVVIAGLFRDYRVKRWGRWRPSATSQSLGESAVILDTLINRDRYSGAEAVQVVMQRSELNEKQVYQLLSKLPMRESLRPAEVSVDAAVGGVNVESADGAEHNLKADERDRVEQTLSSVFEALPSDDRILLKMKFWERMSVADISRIAGIPQKQLYRRLEKIVVSMRNQLLRSGITSEDVRDLFAN
jgi:RNA polymerase sigma factor (sigma-70 family)